MSSVSSSTQSALWTNHWAPIQITPEKPIELKQEVKDIFGDNIYEFFTTKSDNPISKFENINERRLFRILNGIIDQGQEGKELLEVLKTYLKETKLKVGFYNGNAIEFHSECFLGLIDNKIPKNKSNWSNAYGILKQGGFSIPIMLVEESKIEKLFESMFVFDGKEFISIPSSLVMEKEAYMVSHEISHAISCIDFLGDVTSKKFNKETEESSNIFGLWDKRKNDWESFLNTPRMTSVQAGLRQVGFEDGKIGELFKKFFSNTEEARNLLGFESNLTEKIIGEFEIFFRRSDQYLLTYFYGQEKFTTDDENFLCTIAKILEINLPNTRKEKDYSGYIFV